jgi:hypothetical protein
MRVPSALLALFWALPAAAVPPCDASHVDLLVLGDSQTGATWATSFFGNFLQKCLAANHPVGSFAIYGRGATTPAHWLDGGMESVAVIQRDINDNHKNIGSGDAVPLCKRRLPQALAAHTPKKVAAFFGDNLLGQPPQTVTAQFDRFVAAISQANVAPENCLIVTPTYEMETGGKRSVPSKDLANTQKVAAAARAAMGGRCLIVDGTDLMRTSSHLIEAQGGPYLMRHAVAGTSGCGASADNIHVCGEAARDLANRVCDRLR